MDKVRLLRALGYLLVLQFAFGLATSAGQEWKESAEWVVALICALLALPFVLYRHGGSVRTRRFLQSASSVAVGLSVLGNSFVLGDALGWPIGVVAFLVQLGLMAYYFYLLAERREVRPQT